MNVVISGPFGRGSLADEAVLAGILTHLKRPKNTLSVLSADPKGTKKLHDVEALKVTEPNSLLSNKFVWEAFEKSHLFVLAGAGLINAKGKNAARIWLGQLENAQTAGLQTAVMGIGAEVIVEARDRARVQRLLHHCVDGITARDESSKKAVISYGMNPNRVSFNGDLVLALSGAVPVNPDAAASQRVGIVLATGEPSRTEFGFDPLPPSEAMQAFTREFIAALFKKGASSIHLFHDDVSAMEDFADKLLEIDDEKIDATSAAEPIAKIQAEMAACSVVFSFSLHGLMLAAASGVLAAGLKSETGAAEFLAATGLSAGVADSTDANAAAKIVLDLVAAGAPLRETVKARMAILKRKEAQNARMLELLVPRRIARDRAASTGELKPAKMRDKYKSQDKFKKRENTDNEDFED